jgi:hypothetical protein
MRKSFLSIGFLSICSLFVGCGGSIGGGSSSLLSKEVDYKVLENKEETKKIFDEIVTKLGDEAKITDEIAIWISRPSVEGHIKKAGAPDNMSITVDTQDPSNPKRIKETRYWSDNGGWQPSQQMEVNVMGSSSDKENFRLEDELFDFNATANFDTFFKVLTDAMAKYKDADKFAYQYIYGVKITQVGYEISVYGKLSANDQEKKQYYHADFSGKEKK